MTSQEIRANKNQIYQCAKAFRNDATTLMQQLALKFNFNLHDCDWPSSVSKTSIYNKGVLNMEWTFYTHGSHFRFEGLQTGQVVEVLYVEKPEFGVLDGFFFYTYMQTTDRFKDLAIWFGDHSNVYAALELLSEEGMLTKIQGIGTLRVIAL